LRKGVSKNFYIEPRRFSSGQFPEGHLKLSLELGKNISRNKVSQKNSRSVSPHFRTSKL